MDYFDGYDNRYEFCRENTKNKIKKWIKKNSVYLYDSKGHIYNKKGLDVFDEYSDKNGDVQLIPAKAFLKKLEEL